MGIYQVIVGNVGTVMDVDDGPTANAKYLEFVRISKEPLGRAAGEQVTLMMNGEPIKEYSPEFEQE